MSATGEPRGMASLFIWGGNDGVSDEEINLGTPDKTEAKNLAHHVERCAYRYRLFTKRQAAQSRAMSRVELMMIGLLAFTAVTSPQARDVLKTIYGLLG